MVLVLLMNVVDMYFIIPSELSYLHPGTIKPFYTSLDPKLGTVKGATFHKTLSELGATVDIQALVSFLAKLGTVVGLPPGQRPGERCPNSEGFRVEGLQLHPWRASDSTTTLAQHQFA